MNRRDKHKGKAERMIRRARRANENLDENENDKWEIGYNLLEDK
jgi:hypothetical protein